MALLEVQNLVKSFDAGGGTKRVAVDDVSICVDSGETLGLVGESGCGKTTLSRCILRLESATSGKIIFNGDNVSHHSGEQLKNFRQSLQIVFQDPYASLDPRWTIGHTIAEPLLVHKIVSKTEINNEVSRLLDSVGLPTSAAGRYPHQFSGGQRQRIGIARALALRPKFLIADEPVSALDVSVRAQILNLLRDIQAEQNIGMLFIAHDLGAVRQVSKRIAVMYLGKIMETGATDEIFENPRHPYTRSLLEAIPSIRFQDHKKIKKALVEPIQNKRIDLKRGCRFRDRCAFAQPICTDSEPQDIQIKPGHYSRCHFAEKLPDYLNRSSEALESVV